MEQRIESAACSAAESLATTSTLLTLSAHSFASHTRSASSTAMQRSIASLSAPWGSAALRAGRTNGLLPQRAFSSLSNNSAAATTAASSAAPTPASSAPASSSSSSSSSSRPPLRRSFLAHHPKKIAAGGLLLGAGTVAYFATKASSSSSSSSDASGKTLPPFNLEDYKGFGSLENFKKGQEIVLYQFSSRNKHRGNQSHLARATCRQEQISFFGLIAHS